MSNTAMAITFLSEKPEDRFLTIVNQSNNTPVGKSTIYLSDIPNNDLAGYVKLHIGNIQQSTLVWVELRQKSGTSSHKKGAFAIEVKPEFQQQVVQVPAAAPLPAVVQAAPVQNQQLGNSMIEFLGNPDMLGKMVMPFVNAERLKDRENQVDDLKQEVKDLKHENKVLDLELRDALKKLGTADGEKTLAVMLANASNKGFMDSEGMQKFIASVPDLIEKITVAKMGNAPETIGLGLPQMSTEKADFVNYVIDNLNDDQVIFLGSVIRHMSKQNFVDSLNVLITQYNATV